MKRREVIKVLEKNGFILARNGGNHDVYFNPVTMITVPLKRHSEIEDITVKKILKQAGIK